LGADEEIRAYRALLMPTQGPAPGDQTLSLREFREAAHAQGAELPSGLQAWYEAENITYVCVQDGRVSYFTADAKERWPVEIDGRYVSLPVGSRRDFGPAPGDPLPTGIPQPEPPKPSKLPRWLQRLLRSEVQPTVITDKGGTSRPGIRWGKRF